MSPASVRWRRWFACAAVLQAHNAAQILGDANNTARRRTAYRYATPPKELTAVHARLILITGSRKVTQCTRGYKDGRHTGRYAATLIPAPSRKRRSESPYPARDEHEHSMDCMFPWNLQPQRLPPSPPATDKLARPPQHPALRCFVGCYGGGVGCVFLLLVA